MTAISHCDWEECGKGLLGSGSEVRIGRIVHGQPQAGISSPPLRRFLADPSCARRNVLRPTYRLQACAYRCRVPDQIFADPRLAAIYDDIDGDHDDLDHY